MIRFSAGLLGCALLLAAALVRAQEAAPLLKHTFDEGDDGWAAVGVNARATIDRQYPLEGAGALKLEYDLQKGRFGVVSFQAPAGSLAGAKTFRFSAFADNSTTLALLVQIGSVTWMAPFVVNKGAWQKVEISVDDLLPLAPTQDGAPLRPAMEQATALSVGDAAVLIGLLGNDDIARLLGIVPGPRMLRLDSFSVSTEALPGAYTARDGTIYADTFVRPQLGWIALGGATLRRLPSRVPDERGLEARYEQTAQRIIAFMRPIPRGKLKGMGRLEAGLASTKGAQIVVQLEEAGGGKFQTTVEVPEEGAKQTLSVDFANLTPADDSAVKDRPVDPERVTQLVVIDMTGMMGRTTPVANTLTVTGLRFTPAR